MHSNCTLILDYEKTLCINLRLAFHYIQYLVYYTIHVTSHAYWYFKVKIYSNEFVTILFPNPLAPALIGSGCNQFLVMKVAFPNFSVWL